MFIPTTRVLKDPLPPHWAVLPSWGERRDGKVIVDRSAEYFRILEEDKLEVIYKSTGPILRDSETFERKGAGSTLVEAMEDYIARQAPQ